MPDIEMVKNKDLIKQKKLKKMKSRPKKTSKIKDLSTMTTDSFLDKIENESIKNKNVLKSKKSSTESKESSEDNRSNESDNSDTELDPIAHQKSLSALKDTDPEFYKFLEQNDKKLLDFNISDVFGAAADDDDELSEAGEDNVHIPNEELEVASDESDFEPEETHEKKIKVFDKGKVTLKVLKQWRENLVTDKSSKTIVYVMKAFHAALLQVSSEEEQKRENCEFKVEGSAVFNGVIQICVLDLQPAIKRFLKIPPGSKQPPHKCKKFSKIKLNLKNYLSDLTRLLGGVTSSNILTVLLKHLHHMSPMVVSYNKIANKLLKRLIQLWGTQEDTVRVVAFLCILRITNNQRATYLHSVLKKMYMTYVVNSKFVSPGSLPGINFMRRSLVEMFALDLNFSYEHVFLYIRQLAIHLRNAITLKKKENIQAVYNWQFINSIHLWAELLAATCHKPQLQQLIYPLTQVCIGTLKMIPTSQYYPLRFHCIEILIQLSQDSGVYIPILPFIYEILSMYDFGKKHKKVSMKPIHFTCILRLSKSQLSENGFKDAVIESIYVLLLKYLASQSHSLAFPDLVLPLIFELKKFLKNCSVTNYCKKMKQILEKINENSKMIENERKQFTYSLSDQKQIQARETHIKNKGTPLGKFYENWIKINDIQKKKKATKNDEIGDFNLPTIIRAPKRTHSEMELKSEGPVELFPSDSENDDNAPGLDHKTKRGKRSGKKQKKEHIKSKKNNSFSKDDNLNVNDEQDVVLDAKLSDW